MVQEFNSSAFYEYCSLFVSRLFSHIIYLLANFFSISASITRENCFIVYSTQSIDHTKIFLVEMIENHSEREKKNVIHQKESINIRFVSLDQMNNGINNGTQYKPLSITVAEQCDFFFPLTKKCSNSSRHHITTHALFYIFNYNNCAAKCPVISLLYL